MNLSKEIASMYDDAVRIRQDLHRIPEIGFQLHDTQAYVLNELRRCAPDRLETLAAMPEQGVELILNPGCDLESSRTAVALAEEFPHVYAAVGVHPSDCGEWGEGTLLELRQLASRPKVRAIGEIGLTGELRAVSALGQRLSEVRRLGFTKCLIPKRVQGKLSVPEGLDVIRVANIREALAAIL